MTGTSIYKIIALCMVLCAAVLTREGFAESEEAKKLKSGLYKYIEDQECKTPVGDTPPPSDDVLNKVTKDGKPCTSVTVNPDSEYVPPPPRDQNPLPDPGPKPPLPKCGDPYALPGTCVPNDPRPEPTPEPKPEPAPLPPPPPPVPCGSGVCNGGHACYITGEVPMCGVPSEPVDPNYPCAKGSVNVGGQCYYCSAGVYDPTTGYCK